MGLHWSPGVWIILGNKWSPRRAYTVLTGASQNLVGGKIDGLGRKVNIILSGLHSGFGGEPLKIKLPLKCIDNPLRQCSMFHQCLGWLHPAFPLPYAPLHFPKSQGASSYSILFGFSVAVRGSAATPVSARF